MVKKRQPPRSQPAGMPKSLTLIWPYIVMIVLAFLVLVPIAPHIQLTPSTDSSVFLYVGDRILEGAVPYRDVWDHKGPLIYYIDALGLALANGSRWGVWVFEFLAVGAAVLIAYSLMKRALGAWPAIFASVLFLIELRLVLDLGNLVEEFALPLQFLLIWLFWVARQRKNLMLYFWIGVVAALCFLLRPNIIGVPLAIGLILAWRVREERSENFNYLAVAASGGLLVLTSTAVYFLLAQALPQLWDSMFAFNFAYNAEAGVKPIEVIFSGLKILPISTFLGATGFVMAILSLRSTSKTFLPVRDLAMLMVVGIPVEITLTSLNGNSFAHYYMTWLPLFAISSAFLLHFIRLNMVDSLKDHLHPDRVSTAMAATLTILLVITPLTQLLPVASSSVSKAFENGGLPPVDLRGHRYEPVLNYLFKNVPEDQSVLVWGNQATINWLTDHNAPTRFVYQTPLFVSGYTNAEKIRELILDLQEHPGVIIDTAASSGFIPPVNANPVMLPEKIRPLYEYLGANYTYAGTFRPTSWDLYLYRGEGVPLE